MTKQTIHRILTLITASLILCALTIASSAQTRKKKPVHKRAATHTTATPAQSTTPALSGADIISRSADEYARPTVVTEPLQPAPTADRSTTVGSPDAAAWIRELQDRINKLEAASAKKETYEERQKGLLLNLDIITPRSSGANRFANRSLS